MEALIEGNEAWSEDIYSPRDVVAMP